MVILRKGKVLFVTYLQNLFTCLLVSSLLPCLLNSKLSCLYGAMKHGVLVGNSLAMLTMSLCRLVQLLTYWSIPCHWSFSIPYEIRKPLIFCFQRFSKESIGME